MAAENRRPGRAPVLCTALLVLAAGWSAVPPAAAAPVTSAGPGTISGSATTGSVQVTGSGFGHGAGLSQYGAYGMARAGSTATQILKHYYSEVDVARFRDDVDVRVNVAHSADGVTLSSTALASGGGGVRLVPAGGPAVSVSSGDSVNLRPRSGGVVVAITRASGGTTTLTTAGLTVRWQGTRALPGPATIVRVTSAFSGGAARKVRSYRWGSLAVTTAGPALEAVAVLDLHGEYLRGVAEMPSSWPTAALQAQVVAARDVALVAAGTIPRASCGGCHLWDDTRSQVYTGWAKESETVGSTRYGDRWVAAVAATQTSPTTGLTVLHRGRPISANYASSTGGRTRDAVDVWGNAVPYLVSVADPWSLRPQVNPTYARWTRTATVGRLLSLFGLPDLATLAVTRRDSGGAAKVVTATSSDGTRRTLSGNSLTRSLGLPGAWITSFALPRGTSPPLDPARAARRSWPTRSPGPRSAAVTGTSTAPSGSSTACCTLRRPEAGAPEDLRRRQPIA